jgi:predicted choloylglycine hydrolase
MQPEINIKIKQQHLVLRGSAESIGRQQGGMIQGFKPAVDYFSSGPVNTSSAPVDRTIKLMEKYCPGLVEEMSGFCQVAGFPLEKLVYLSMTHIGSTNCSHFVALPAATANGHVLVGRNYDFGEKADDLKLTTVFPEGCYANTGFPTLFFGRNDGLNEHGLSVTLSVGGMPVGIMPGQHPPLQEGLQFWAMIRTILETCKTVDEAEACFSDFPCSGNPILIFADAGGHASLAETYGPHKKITRLGGGTPFLAATNHFQSEELRKVEPMCMAHSIKRLNTANNFLKENAGKISLQAMKELLGTRYPEGLCTHYYQEFFGTLHSCVFDLTERFIEVTFGSPAVNAWHRIDFNNPQPGEFESVLPNEYSTPEFWAPAG